MTTILTVAPLVGHGRVTEAACDPVTMPCSGANTDTQHSPVTAPRLQRRDAVVGNAGLCYAW